MQYTVNQGLERVTLTDKQRNILLEEICRRAGWTVEQTHEGRRAIAFAGDGRARVLYTVHSDENLWAPDKDIYAAMDVLSALKLHCGWLNWAGQWFSSEDQDPIGSAPYFASDSLCEAIFLTACAVAVPGSIEPLEVPSLVDQYVEEEAK